MKHTVKKRIALVAVLLSVSMLFGCGKSVAVPYSSVIGNSSFQFSANSEEKIEGFAQELCVGESNINLPGYDIEQVGADGLFDLNQKTVLHASNMHERMYPASLTKLLTALVAVKHGTLDQALTASSEVYITEYGAVIAGLKMGDTMTLEQALHLLLIRSCNDVANLIAENIAGSVADFVDLMNEEAQKLGATNSHFVNAHGLHDMNHYSTVYDIYLIYKEAIKYEAITQIIGMTSYATTYHNKYGTEQTISVSSTNGFFKKQYKSPENVTILGSKTGTTDEAGSCLALYVKDTAGNPYLSIILNGVTKDDLYTQMRQLLEQINR